MRQVVSLVAEGQVQYALVDDDSGEFTPFAIIELPNPERFGLHEAALLGTNLIQAIGLNGAKRPKVTVPRVDATSPADERLALPPEPPARTETVAERKRRSARESYHRNKANNSHSVRHNNNAQRFVSMDEVLAVINQYPDGIRLRDVAERIWRSNEGQGTDETYPAWCYAAVSNRLTGCRTRLKEKGIPLPFREEDREEPDKSGTYRGFNAKYLYPI